MKKFLLLFFSLMVVTLTLSSNYKVVIKATQETPKGHTEVTPYSPDSVVVVPGIGVTDIYINIKDNLGTTHSQYSLPANVDMEIELQTPNNSEGCSVEIEDNKGKVFTNIN